MEILLFVLLFSIIMLSVSLYSLIKVLRGFSRSLERERNVHNAQVSELLDRLAVAVGQPYNIPPRPPAEVAKPYDPANDPELQVDWKEV